MKYYHQHDGSGLKDSFNLTSRLKIELTYGEELPLLLLRCSDSNPIYLCNRSKLESGVNLGDWKLIGEMLTRSYFMGEFGPIRKSASEVEEISAGIVRDAASHRVGFLKEISAYNPAALFSPILEQMDRVSDLTFPLIMSLDEYSLDKDSKDFDYWDSLDATYSADKLSGYYEALKVVELASHKMFESYRTDTAEYEGFAGEDGEGMLRFLDYMGYYYEQVSKHAADNANKIRFYLDQFGERNEFARVAINDLLNSSNPEQFLTSMNQGWNLEDVYEKVVDTSRGFYSTAIGDPVEINVPSEYFVSQ